MLFHDRKEAGKVLAKELKAYQNQNNVIILGLARGGVVVAYEVAQELGLPLNVVAPRKIGAPGNPELALGSIMENEEGIFNDSIIAMLNVSQDYIAHEIEKEKKIAQQRLALYRQHAPLPDIKGQTVILVDDGIATGSTMLTVVEAMRKAQARKVIVAAPVSSTDAFELLLKSADEVICPYVREDFVGVGMYFRYFDQTADDEVVQLLRTSSKSS